MSALETCSTYSAGRRHLSANLTAQVDPPPGLAPVPGRRGVSLCGQTAYDAERMLVHRVTVVIEKLPCCRNCEVRRRNRGLIAPEGWSP